jgi:hypothetical protein
MLLNKMPGLAPGIFRFGGAFWNVLKIERSQKTGIIPAYKG